MTHANAPFSPVGRRRIAVLIVDGGLPIRRAAERFQCSPATAKRWADRYRAGLPMTDRSSRPHTSPNQLPTKTERRIINLRFNRKWGPHRISYHLRIPRSTVGRVLERYNMPRLCDIDQATGLPVRKPKPKRYEVTAPGELVHIDIKKQGRIPDGGGWRVHGRGSEGHHGAQRNKIQARKTVPVRGYRYLHHAVDDNSRVAYSEILDDEKKETAASFWKRANAFFNDLGITVKAVMTDNGACYRSAAFSQALGEGIKHKRTKPYRPQTNGKVERFNKTLASEWAYARPYTSESERADTYQAWLHHYNHHRPHTGIAGQTPSQRVHNVTGKYT
ncbi:IS481 family transposase [Flaviflexus sp.]|uniref:IS481 family transposase n=1 Tax=Flaviflexus sp. TaxID=1969482 RepID=UPI003F8E64E6